SCPRRWRCASPVVQGGDAGQRFAFEELERRTATRRYVREARGMAETLDGGHGIAAADHRRRATRCDGLRHALRARGETVVLEDAHRPVPENGPRPRDLPGK